MTITIRCAIGLVAVAASLSACHGTSDANRSKDEAKLGRLAIERFACGSCHEIDGVPGAEGRIGPVLSHFGSQLMIAGHVPNTMDNLVRWILDPDSIAPGTAMPDLGVPDSTARHMAAYLMRLR